MSENEWCGVHGLCAGSTSGRQGGACMHYARHSDHEWVFRGQQPVTSCTWHLELQPLSHVHVDGTIEGDCPLQLAGVSDDERMSV